MQIPDNYEFLIYPKIVSGQCALENLPSELEGNNAQKPLVITSQAIARTGLTRTFVKAFYDSTAVIGAIYDPVLDYAGISQARQAARLFVDRGCDAIIALGGGPVTALAKAVNVLVSEKCDTLQPYYEGAAIGPLKPLIVISAGAIDGQEAMPAATVDNRSICSDNIYPGVFVLDGRMTAGLSPQIVAESAIIAMAQGFMALTTPTPNPMIDALAHPALSLISRHLITALQRPKDKNASLALANAAVMAGAACANIVSGPALTLARALGRATGISLGKCLGILLPAFIYELQKSRRPVRDEVCLAMAGLEGFAAIDARDRSQKGLEMVVALIREMKGFLPSSLQSVRIQRHLLEAVAQSAESEGAGQITATECRAVLNHAWEVNA